MIIYLILVVGNLVLSGFIGFNIARIRELNQKRKVLDKLIEASNILVKEEITAENIIDIKSRSDFQRGQLDVLIQLR